MNILFVIFLSLFAETESVPAAHEFHLSNSTINYNSEEKSIQISMRMFIDDLELALEPIAGDSLQICTRKESLDAEDYIYSYVLEHLKLEIGGKKVSPLFIGKEASDDLAAVWCYLEVENVESFESISITNNIMIEIFDDQKNMTNIQLNKKRIEDILFTVDKTSEKIEFND